MREGRLSAWSTHEGRLDMANPAGKTQHTLSESQQPSWYGLCVCVRERKRESTYGFAQGGDFGLKSAMAKLQIGIGGHLHCQTVFLSCCGGLIVIVQLTPVST